MEVTGWRNTSTGRTHFFILCDGTMVFEERLVSAVKAAGYADVKVERTEAVSPDSAPEGKPWCNYLIEVSAKAPECGKEGWQ